LLRVGLTGNIASGKSSVVGIWRDLGAFVVDADELARRVVEPGTAGLAAIVDRWGEDVLDATGRLDREAMREIVFADAAAREALEAIVHPAVARLRDREMEDAERAGHRIAVSDIPLLFEVGMQDDFDLVVVVDAPEGVRRERLVRDRGLTEDAARRMMAAQMPATEKRARADLVLENSGTLEDLERAARDAWVRIRERAAS
jgi:dephospho-CoA kinase